MAVGLAWTPVGGDVLFIEAGRMPGGNKGLIMTGQLGPVMQESVQAALTWVRGNAVAVRHRSGPVQDQRHSHPRAGRRDSQGRPLGGDHHGGGAAFPCSPTGACGRNLAMTGEITLTGQVLPVGGIKEKVLAAKRSGVREVILPFENEVNVREDLKSEQIGEMQHPLREDHGGSGGTGVGAEGLAVVPGGLFGMPRNSTLLRTDRY